MRTLRLEHGCEPCGNGISALEHSALACEVAALPYRPIDAHTEWTSSRRESDTKSIPSLKPGQTLSSGLDRNLQHNSLPTASSAVPRSSLSFILNPPIEDPTSAIEATTKNSVKRKPDGRSRSEGSSTAVKAPKKRRGTAHSDENMSTRPADDPREIKKQKESDARKRQAKLYCGVEEVLMGCHGVVYERFGFTEMNSHNQENDMTYSKEATLICATTKLRELAAFLPLIHELALSFTQVQQALSDMNHHPQSTPQVLGAVTQSFKLAQREYQDHLQQFDLKRQLDVARAEALRDHFRSLQQSLKSIQEG